VSNRPWARLRTTIDELRSERRNWYTGMVVCLQRAHRFGICDRFAAYRVSNERRIIELRPQGNVTMLTRSNPVPAIALLNLPQLVDARLAFRITLAANEKSLEQYTISVVGTERRFARGWYVRIDLDAEQRGHGPCSHPMLHCHIGVDATKKGGQETRAPMPPLGPDEALTWVLATLDPRLEPEAP
jgi:hypothetical protein